MIRSLHIVRSQSGSWEVKGGNQSVGTASTQSEAVRKARDLVRRANGELVIHARDGRIVDRHVAKPATAKAIKQVLRKAYAKG